MQTNMLDNGNSQRQTDKVTAASNAQNNCQKVSAAEKLAYCLPWNNHTDHDSMTWTKDLF